MSNHVGVGKIQHDQVVVLHARKDFIRDFERAHLRL